MATTDIDDLDRRIMQALRLDPTATNRQLAREFEVAQSTISMRLRALRESGALRVACSVDLRRAGYDLPILLGFRVRTRDLDRIANQLAKIPEMNCICVVSGEFDLSAILMAKDREHLRSIIEGPMAAIDGIDNYLADIALTVRLYSLGFSGPLDAAAEPIELGHLDRLDNAIASYLVRDATTSLSEIARLENVAIGTVRSRLQKLQKQGHVRFEALSDPTVLGRTAVAFVGLSVAPAHQDQVAAYLTARDEVSLLAYTMGRRNLFALVACHSQDELSSLLTEDLARLDGVERTETADIRSVLKVDHRWTLSPDGGT